LVDLLLLLFKAQKEIKTKIHTKKTLVSATCSSENFSSALLQKQRLCGCCGRHVL